MQSSLQINAAKYMQAQYRQQNHSIPLQYGVGSVKDIRVENMQGYLQESTVGTLMSDTFYRHQATSGNIAASSTKRTAIDREQTVSYETRLGRPINTRILKINCSTL